MKPDRAKLALPLGLLGLNVAISLGFLLGGKLPDPAPAGFWIDGSVLSEAPAWVVAFRLPMIMAVLLLSIGAALKWDPRFSAPQRRRRGAWGAATNIVLAVGCLGNFNYLSAASAGAFLMTPLHVIPLGLLLIGVGNVVAKSASNGFWGLHTPWTRQHESVERRTNRLLGILWMLEGLGLVLASPFIGDATSWVASWAALGAGGYLALTGVAIVLLAFLPIGIAALASYQFAKQAPTPAVVD